MPAEHESVPSSNAAAPAPGVLPILIVDDEPEILAMLRDVLEEAGFAVLTAQDGKAALDLLTHTPVALVLTDLMMPEVSGLQLAQQMHSAPEQPRFPCWLYRLRCHGCGHRAGVHDREATPSVSAGGGQAARARAACWAAYLYEGTSR